MNILFCGGGTAGHITPAIALAEAFLKKHPKADIAFIGRDGGKENELIKASGFSLYTITVEGLSRTLSAENIRKIKNAFKARSKAAEIISEFKPDMVIGTGGYVCWPVLTAAKRMGIKTALHESNATPGLTSKLLYKHCDLFLTGTDMKKYKHKNTYFTGNPLREKFKTIPKDKAKAIMGISKEQKLIISVGGSIGAEELNDACLSLMEDYSIPNSNICHLHSVGHRYFDKLKEAKPYLCKGISGCKAVPFISDMPVALCAADVVISRCGAMTLSEIAFCSAASVLIPSPNVTGNHQLKNALCFKEKNAAVMIEETDLTEALLRKKVELILKNDEFRECLQKNVSKLAVIGAAEKTAELLENKLLTK